MNKELRTRSITGLAIVVLIVGAITAGILSAQIFILAICALSSYELISMSLPDAGKLTRITFVVFAILPLSGTIVDAQQQDNFFLALPALSNMWALPLLLALYAFVVITAGASRPNSHITSMAIALLLFSGAGIFAIDIINISPMIIMGVFILIWSNDVFAYLVGSRFGKSKLAPTISPGKTWEGFIGGGIMSIASGILLSTLMTDLGLVDWIVISVLVVIFGTTGDLVQSAIKRHYQVKDSGNLLPGHGGFWDRFDSFFGCVPFVSVYLIQTMS